MTSVSARDFPVGIEDFEELVTKGKKYVDKTGALEDLLESGDAVALLLRPRRFGKTLSMSMLQNFLELNYADPEDRSRQERLFQNLNVYGKREFCDRHMGRYPVISISLKDVDGETFEDAMRVMKIILHKFFQKFRFLLNSDKQYEDNKNLLKEKFDICSSTKLNLSDAENMSMLKEVAKDSLAFMSGMLYDEYGLKSIIIVDEYDVPLQKAKANSKKKTSPDEKDYYDKMLEVIRGMLSLALKTNSFMEKGFVTGCLRIAHQSVFTGINHFSCYGVKDASYSKFIGFTREETVNLLKQCGMENRLEDVLTWYDGYNIGGSEMLCPWSVLNFLSRALAPENNPAPFQPENYWANSSGNDILEICMKRAKANTSRRLQNLLDGGTEVIKKREFTTYPDIAANNDFDVFATMMLHTGYLTVDRNAPAPAAAGHTVAVKIPNREVLECFRDKVDAVFGRSNPVWLEKSQKLLAALFAGDADSAATIIRSMLLSFLSSRDTAYEGIYHAFLLGIMAIAADEANVDIKSNSERGDGYSDLVLCDDDKAVAVIIEFKKSDSQSRSAWKKLSAEALEQIDKQNYDFNLREDYDVVHKYGIAFHGKHCMVAHKECRGED